MRVLLCQHGSRRGYAVPRMLEQAGILEGLYTDTTAFSIIGRLAGCLKLGSPQRIKKLLNRIPCGIPRHKIFSTDKVLWFEITKNFRCFANKEKYEYIHWCKVLSRKMIKWGVGNADAIYNMYAENLEFIKYAKSKGLRIITDVYMNPQTKKIISEECERFPEWAKAYHSTGCINFLADVQIEEMIRLSDVLVCPSQWVIDGLSKLRSFDSSKIELVPYGCSINYNGQKNDPIPGRVLFAGRDVIRKGLPYLGQSAITLHSKNRNYDFRVAGVQNDNIRRQPLCRELNFIGQLTIEQMKSEFLSADVFVLPTLSEGFAGVCIQAMTAGVPVITTPCAGTPIRSGVDGILVPTRSVDALVNAIDECIQNRTMRNDLANAAYSSSEFFSEKRWSERLIKAISIYE